LAGSAFLVGGASPASAAEQSPFGVITLDPSTAIEDGQTITLYAQRLAPNTVYSTVQCNLLTLHCDTDRTSFTTDGDGNATAQVTPERVIEGAVRDVTFSEDCGVAPRTCVLIAFSQSGDDALVVDSYGASLTFAPAPK
jgi:hypothetical protein